MDGRRATDHDIAALAVRQGGVVSRAQLIGLGLTRAAIDQRVRRGRLHLLHRGAYAVGHPLVGRRGRWFAVLLACEGSVLSHRSAAAAWDLRPTPGGRVEVTVSGSGGRRSRPGLCVHRCRLGAGEVTHHEALAITEPARTLLDLAALLAAPALEQAVVRAETLRLLDLTALLRLVDRYPRRAGTPVLRAVLAQWDPASSPGRSELEERFLLLCHGSGLPRPTVNTVVEGIEVDFAWRARRLVVEVDGFAFHRSPAAFERDRARDVILVLAGWRVLRFSWMQVTRDPGAVAGAVGRALAGPTAR